VDRLRGMWEGVDGATVTATPQPNQLFTVTITYPRQEG